MITEETKDEQTTAAAPKEPEITEENFVPDFNQEYDQKRAKRRRIILICLACVAVVLGVVVVIGRGNSLYSRIMRRLEFDYRDGEEIDMTTLALTGSAERLAEKVSGKHVTLTANVYCFNSEGGLALTASQYTYDRSSSGEADLQVVTGTANSLKSVHSSCHAERDGSVSKKDGDPAQNEITAAGALFDFCFAAESHDQVTVQLRDYYETNVGDGRYTCEVWTMSAPADGTTKYFTLYRYYSGGSLKGLRLLDASGDLMYVYDITKYTAE